jgi:hypothetical protein
MKPSVYIETTVPSYYTARPSRDVIVAGHQATTREWWEKRLQHFEVFISQLVLDEAAVGDPDFAARRLAVLKPFPLLDLRDNVSELAHDFVDAGPIAANAARDALHIALAACHGMDFLLTWNCAHIANAEIIPKITGICHEHGLECPVICTPDELMGI